MIVALDAQLTLGTATGIGEYAAGLGQALRQRGVKIVELRDKAKTALGDRFSLREFHNTILRTGTVPLDILERQVDGYIGAVRRA